MRSSSLARTALRVTFRRPIAVRSYLGQAGDMKPVVSAQEEALLKIAKPKSDAILDQHTRMPSIDRIEPAALGLDPKSISKNDDNSEMELDIRRKRLVYRSKQRGWLEVDLLLGTWANQNVPSLNQEELDQYEAFVNLETIDIYNVVTLRWDVPEEMKTADGNGVVERIQAWARDSPLGKADPDMYKKVKMENQLI